MKSSVALLMLLPCGGAIETEGEDRAFFAPTGVPNMPICGRAVLFWMALQDFVSVMKNS